MSQPVNPAGFNLRGAVDLGAVAARSAAAARAESGGADAPAGVVVHVTEAQFPAVVEQSMTVPVVVLIGMAASTASTELDGTLTSLASEYAGAFQLAKVDAQAEPRIAQAFAVQAVPTVMAVLRGQPVPLFQGAMPAEQLREVLDELLRVAAQNGVTGRLDVAGAAAGEQGAAEPGAAGAPAQPAEPTEPPLPPLPPLHQKAYDALMVNDFDGAIAAYTEALAQNPADEDARAGLAQASLLKRTDTADLGAARAAAAADPTDVPAQLLVADLDLAGGHVEDAFARLLDLVRRTSGEQREAARAHLVELFTVVGSADPRVTKARGALAAALF